MSDNYIVIDGKKIELSQDTIDNIKNSIKEENKYIPFVKRAINDDESTTILFSNSEMRMSCVIGYGFAPKHLEHRCLLLSNKYNWEILPNTNDLIGTYTKLLVATKK